MKNDFLLELLALQQDGRRAISAPSNWTTQAPLLEVKTEVDEIVDELLETILQNNGQNKTARWHFFIGSPGNGKSAAMGKLCRQLLSEGACRVCDESGVAIQDLDETEIPYAILVYEGSNKYASVQIVQDASVVRNPFSPEVDPATELLRTLEESWDKGISLIVCTNRGVLEKAHRDKHMDRGVNSKPWFKILAALVSADTLLSGGLEGPRNFDNKKTVFEVVNITYSHLDNRSLLLGRDTFDNLFRKAAEHDRWRSCESCTSREMCPFKANRDWLADPEARQRVLQLLKRAEVFSGQVIVFREALALISLILAGCPRDYDGVHPCEWVQEKNLSGDVFSLAVRRIYMCLFASYCPHGLEASGALRKRQLEALQTLVKDIGDENPEIRKIMEHVINASSPSTDVGVTRLLDRDGVIANIDPCREALPPEFYDSWDSCFEATRQGNPAVLGAIEEACAEVWEKLEQGIEFTAEHWASEAYWAIRRWSSNYFLHLGALADGRSAWVIELDNFAELLGLVNRLPEHRTLEDKRKIRQLNSELEGLLNAVSDRKVEGAVQLSDTVTLVGRWVNDTLKPKTVASEESGSVSLAIDFQGGERAVLGANMYLWLTRRAAGKLDSRCFPRELLVGAADARIRAAAKGRYAFEDNDVEMIIETDSELVFRIERIDGEVDVRHE